LLFGNLISFPTHESFSASVDLGLGVALLLFASFLRHRGKVKAARRVEKKEKKEVRMAVGPLQAFGFGLLGMATNVTTLAAVVPAAMIDGVSGVDIGTVIFDLTPDPEPVERVEPWEPRRSPSEYELLGQSAGEVAGAPLRLSARALDAVRNPQQIAAKIGEGIEGLAEIAKQFADPAPDVPLNTEITPHRRIAITRASLEDLKTVKNHYGTTVNDVVLATVTGSLRNWLINRGVDVDGLELRALVPVSVRAEDEHGALGNRLAAMRGLLPVYESDPVRRLEIVSAAMDGLKESKQALGAEVIARLNDFAPPTLLAQSGRLNFSTRLFNLLVTNVPGPQIPLYMLGREMSDVFPIPFLAENHGLAVAVISYHGKVDFGLLGDFDAMPDIEMVSEGLNEALAELVATCSED
ncbi:MAG: WS/DGAT domain-containing protein, partial [Solirubrobacterales bacterium]